MNEQQLADLFSAQIDSMLQGHQPVAPAGVADLQPLLALGQQFSQINFQPGATAQAAFQAQLSAWFGPVNGSVATAAWGLSKTLWLPLMAAAITIGAALGVVLLASLPGSWVDFQQQIAPEATQESPEMPAPDNREATAAPSALPPTNGTVLGGDMVSPSSSSKGDTLSPTASSLEDTLPSQPVLEESAPLPTSELTPTATAEIAQGVGDEGGESTSDGDSNNDSGDGSAPTGDHDRGHGNDADGFDEDNTGNSDGLPDNGQGDNSDGSDFSQFSRGDNQGGGNGGQGGGGNGGRSNSGGQGKGKGNK
jgi:hypothetical protein